MEERNCVNSEKRTYIFAVISKSQQRMFEMD